MKKKDWLILSIIEVILGIIFIINQPLCEPCIDEQDCPPCLSNIQYYTIFLFIVFPVIYIIIKMLYKRRVK